MKAPRHVTKEFLTLPNVQLQCCSIFVKKMKICLTIAHFVYFKMRIFIFFQTKIKQTLSVFHVPSIVK